MKEPLQGIIPPTVTPFDRNEDVDEAALAREVDLLFAAGAHGVSFGGSTGEGAVLSDAELARGIEVIRGVNRGGKPVLCGIIRNSTREAVRAGREAKRAGADALMVTPTYYFGASEEGNYGFFRDIAREVGLPIVIYNVIRTNPILPPLMERLSGIDLVVGVKQSVGGIHALADMVRSCGGRTLVFSAQDDLLFASYLLGAVGAISAILTAFPRLCVEQWEAVRKGDLGTARAIHERLLPVWRAVEGGAFPGKLKAVLRLMGRDVGSARRPIREPTEAETGVLREALRGARLI